MKAWLGDVDESTLASSRGFYLPSCPKERSSIAERWHNEGTECFDVMSFAPTEKQLSTKPVGQSWRTSLSPTTSDSDKEVLREALRNTYLGNYEEWWKVASAMLNAGYELQDFEYVTVGGMMSEKTPQDCKRQWDKVRSRHGRGQSISPGYLYNLVGGRKRIKEEERERLQAELRELERQLGETM